MQHEASPDRTALGVSTGVEPAADASIAGRFSTLNRYRKWSLFLSTMRPAPHERLLDIGYTDLEHRPTDNLLEKHYPYKQMITALGVDRPLHFTERYPEVNAVCYDGGRFPFPDGSFDVAWSNAVLEHVGTEETRLERQALFLRETMRVARRAFITTPNRWFPAEIHTRTLFLHWLPKRLFDAYLSLRGKRWATKDYMTLLSEQQLRARLAAAGIHEYDLVKNRLGPFTVDFVVIIQ